jgi:hypothetical protein
MCSRNVTCDHPMHEDVEHDRSHSCIHQSDIHFTSEFTIFSIFRVTVISCRACT